MVDVSRETSTIRTLARVRAARVYVRGERKEAGGRPRLLLKAIRMRSIELPSGFAPYGRRPMPPSSVMVSPLMNLKSGLASCTTTRPISASTSP